MTLEHTSDGLTSREVVQKLYTIFAGSNARYDGRRVLRAHGRLAQLAEGLLAHRDLDPVLENALETFLLDYVSIPLGDWRQLRRQD